MRGTILIDLPSSWRDYLLPILEQSTENTIQISIGFHLPSFPIPSFVGQFFRSSETKPEEKLVADCRRLVEEGHFALCKEGVGGVYFIKNTEGCPVAIFKPEDEEPGGINNPKNIIQNPLLPPGGGAIREVAAYLLDRDHFARVPDTYLMSGVSHPGFNSKNEKRGSLQRFVENDDVSSSMGSSVFDTEDVHRIGTLDVRLFNLDRNGENILVKKEEDRYRLIPIDHTYCLPPIDSLDGAFFEWQYWPQAKKPFSEETLAYIASIDIENDAKILRDLGFSEANILTMAVTTTLLKVAAASGYTLFDIACLMSRGIPLTKPSRLEEIICATNAIVDSSPRGNMSSFLEEFTNQINRIFRPQAKLVNDVGPVGSF